MSVIELKTISLSPLDAAKTLTKASSAAGVRAVLMLAIDLDPLEQAEVVHVVVDRSPFGKRDIKKMLSKLMEDAMLAVPDGASALADHILEKTFHGHLKVAPDGRYWGYAGSHWQEVPETVVRRELNLELRKAPAAFGEGKVTTIVNGALACLRDRCGVETDPMSITLDPPNTINLQNGELWLTNEKPILRPHNPLSGLVHVLPIAFDPNAMCPKFSAALYDIFAKSTDPEGMIRHLAEVMGYAIQYQRNLPRIIIFHGVGANGKSSILRVLTALVGPELVYAGSVASLSRDKFIAAALAGRLLFLDDDVKADLTLDDGALKTMSEAKLSSSRRPYGKQAFSFRSVALPVLATNNVPKINDASHGFERRLMVLPFERRFQKSEINSTLFDEIIKDELPGIMNMALAGLSRLRARKDFEEPAGCLAAKASFLALANPLRGFAQACLIPKEKERASLAAIYDALQAWCARNGAGRPFQRNSLRSRLEGMGYEIYKSEGVPCVKNVRLFVGDFPM